ncbi:helix-turn-helix transcriptional regulator [Burkholderia gladioli]|uniref:helix-turn-helix transcriptional regulator n=1 Tax=Burkholderia gladioli TaxID=28095 RepID=UPI001FC7E175|nr:helix-turn-helix transcriptional regulator [Burkholderia gladioli]
MKKTLADNLAELLATRPDVSRLNLSKAMGVADGTLGRIKYGDGNPTAEVIEKIATFFKIEPWQLLYPNLGRDLLHAAKLGTLWPFATSLTEIARLTPKEIAEVDNMLRFKLLQTEARLDDDLPDLAQHRKAS